MCVYKNDSPGLLERAIKSILAQSFSSFVFHVMVDGPIPIQLRNVLKSHKKIIIHERAVNKGLAFSLNELIDIVMADESQFIARMDSDDFSHESRFKMQVEYFNMHPDVTVLGTACNEVNESGEHQFLKVLPELHDDLVKSFIKRSPFNHPTVMFRKSVFSDGEKYPIDVGMTEDYFLWAKLLANGERFANLQEPLLDFTMMNSTIYRRRGLKKAYLEMKGRFKAMKIIKIYSIRNLFYAVAHFVIRVSPVWLHRLAYRFGR